METETQDICMVNLSDLFDTQSRRDHGDLAGLKDSIQELGLLEPLLITPQHKLIAGRRRFQALTELGIRTVPARIVSPANALEEFRMAWHENKHRRPESWAEERRSELYEAQLYAEIFPDATIRGGDRRKSDVQSENISLCSVPSFTAARAEVFGQTQRTVQSRLQMAHALESHPELASCKTESAARRKLRDIKREAELAAVKGKATNPLPPAVEIVHADCVDWMPEHCAEFDCLIADPPYNTGRMEWDNFADDEQYLGFTVAWLKWAFGCLKAEHHAFIFCPSEHGADYEMILRNIQHRPLSRIVWHHRNLSMGRVIGNGLARTYDLIFHCGTKPLNLSEEWSDKRFDVQTFAAPQTNFDDKKLHQTQKPLELIKWLVEIGSRAGECVLDPFAGAGTTGIACLELERACVLIDADEESAQIARGRIAEWRSASTLNPDDSKN